MAKWNKMIYTEEGRKLLANAAAGTCQVEFVRAEIGDGTYSEEEKAEQKLSLRTQLKNERNSYGFSSIKAEGNTAYLKAALQNTDVDTAYFVSELGVFARKKGSSEDPVLVLIAVAEIADYFPEKSNAITIVQNIAIEFEDVKQLSIADDMGAYALVNTEYNISDTLQSLVSGENMGTALGKLARAVERVKENGESITALSQNVDDLKKNVSDGKGTIASAITDMGVSTASDATFATMAANVKKIFPTPAKFAAKYKNTFRALANAPVNFNGATAVCYGKRIYVHGSCAEGGDFKSMYRYDIVSNTWAKLASSPVEHQWQNNVVLVGDSILYFGNWTGVSIQLYQYNISWNTWTNRNVSIPLAAQGASAFMQGGAVRLLSSNYVSYKNNYYYYSLITNTFTKGANLTDADAADIYGAKTASITVGDKVYLICAKSAEIKIFHVGDFKTIEDVVSPGLSWGTAVKVGNLIYITALNNANTLYIFNIDTKTFTQFIVDHYGYNACCDCFGDEVFYIGSANSGNEKKATNIHTEFCLENLY